MALDFPSSPTVGTIYTTDGRSWIYDGSKWNPVGQTYPLPVTSGGTGASDAPTALTNLGGAPIASPVFTGTPVVPGYAPLANPTLTGLLTAQQITASGAVNLNGAPNNIKGVTDNSDAPAGYVGEFITGSNTFSLANATPGGLAVITVTAGDWDVWAYGTINSGGPCSALLISPSLINTGFSGFQLSELVFSSAIMVAGTNLTSPAQRWKITSTTQLYCVGQVNFSSGPVSVSGYISARRRR